jgi:hypothetical protein
MILGRRSFVLFVGKRRCRNKDNRIQQFRILNPAKFGRAVLRNIPATFRLHTLTWSSCCN